MGVSGALQWLEEWQLRILVLGSLVVQYILLVASVVRKFPIRSWRRPIIWLAYLASDAIAIYALATLFSRRSKPQQEDGDGSSSLLEVLWAPILLIHLGGQDGITAYNIEDNELWTRHILTSVSQVTVAIYVFWKSWPGNDTRLLVAAILLFIFGILKCLEKPWALNRASINSLVSSGEPVRRSINAQKLRIDPLEDFIGKVNSPAEVNTPATPVDFTPYKLFVDLASPSPGDRIGMLRSFSALNDYQAYSKLQYWLSETFQLFYTKEKIFPNLLRQMLSLIEWAGASARARALGYANIREMESSTSVPPFDQGIPISFGFILRGLVGYLLFPTIALFHYSRREAYSEDDVKVTYALLCCTVALQVFAMALKDVTRVIGNPDPQAVRNENGGMLSQYIHLRERHDMRRTKPLNDDMISQYNLIGLLVRNREHSKMMWVVGVLGCDDFLQQRWRMKSCSSSFSITKLVLKYLKDGWEHHIRDVSSYRKFNDNRGQFTLGREGCSEELGWSLEGAFDESVLLWHLATDFCYYGMGASRSYHGYRCMKDSRPHVYACPAWCQGSDHHEGAVQCREMSNYMMYLLFVNPEMLMAGTRRNLFTAAYAELQGTIVEGGESPLAERELTQRIMALGGEGSPDDDSQQEGIIRDARAIARVLSGLPEDKMWAMIEGVWVEMLCFSAARCRGYLHAKGLATGVEYLTYVWLLQYYMGMETLAAKLQRADHRRSGGEREDNPSSYGASRSAFARGQAAGPSRSSGGATEEEHARGQSASYHASYGTLGELV